MGYLKDPTGARRFWPVACRHIDLAGIDRDQLWAEAVRRFKDGQPWHLETRALEALATAEQAARFAIDAWEPPIIEWLGKRTEVAVDQVLEGLGQSTAQANQNRVVKILTRIGFIKYRPRRRGKRPRPVLYRLADSIAPRDPDRPDLKRKPTAKMKSTTKRKGRGK